MIRLLCALLLVFGLAWAGAAGAQDAQGPDYTAWEQDLAQVTAALKDGASSESRLNDLRAGLVDWRARFTAASDSNASAISVVQEQISALGPAPEEGESESDNTANRRAELSAQLSRLEEPGLRATEARAVVEANIELIDKALRARQTDALMTLGPSPLNPAHWPDTLSAITQGCIALANETLARSRDGRMLMAMRENGPAVVILLALALALLLRGRSVIERMATYFERSASIRGQRALGFIVSLGQIAVPVCGLIGLSIAAGLAELTGQRGAATLEAIVAAGWSFFIAHWLARRLFPRDEAEPAAVSLDPAQRRRARLFTSALGFLTGLYQVLNIAAIPTMGLPISDPPERASDAVAAVLIFPTMLLTGLALWQLARLLRRGLAGLDAEAHPNRTRFIGVVARAAMLVAVLAPALAAIGYLSAANALIWPAIQSLALIGAILLLQGFVGDLYAAWMRDAEGARDALIPILVGFSLVLALLPVFALIWGVPAAQLADLWTRFRSGLSLGGVRISPTAILTFAVVFSIGYMITRLFQGTLRNTVLPKTRIDKGGQNAIVSGLGYVGIFLAALAAITSAGIDLSSLAIVAGALSVGIGFGLQNIVSNFVSGIILLIERPISEGDWIEVGGQQGYVRAISVRSTRIETFDRTDVIVPNADFVSGQVINYTRGNSIGRVIVPVGVAYGTDTRLIEKILLEIAEGHPMVMITPPPRVVFTGFGASSLDFEIRAILSDVNQRLSVLSEINHQIAAAFTAQGIEIPFPQQDLWLRNPETLRPDR